MTSASPSATRRAASPMACAPVEHAVTTAWLGPFKPCAIDTYPDARLIKRPGMKNGDTRRGPLSFRTIAVSAMPVRPPIPDPIITGAHLVVVGRRLPACILERLARGTHGEDDEIIDLALFLRLHPLVGIEAAVRAIATRNLTGDLRRQIGNLEGLDAPCPAVAVDEALPGRLDAASERCHHAEPCDDDASHLRFLSPQPISYSPAAARAPRQSPIAENREGPPQMAALAFCV